MTGAGSEQEERLIGLSGSFRSYIRTRVFGLQRVSGGGSAADRGAGITGLVQVRASERSGFGGAATVTSIFDFGV